MQIKTVAVTRTRRFQLEYFDERRKYEHIEFTAHASAEVDSGDDETDVLKVLEDLVEDSITRQVAPLKAHADKRQAKLKSAYPELEEYKEL